MWKCFSRPSKDKLTSKDELIGGWYNGADDGSGLNGIWGYGIEFKSDGSGSYWDWGVKNKTGEKEVLSWAFEWIRVDKTKIKLKAYDEDSWEEIEYEITLFTGAYQASFKKIVTKGTNEFWGSPEPLYKHIA